MMGLNVVLQMIRRSRRVEVSGVPKSDARTRFAAQVQSLRLVVEQNPHVWIQLSLGAPCIPGRGGKEENISAQKILWLRFLGYRWTATVPPILAAILNESVGGGTVVLLTPLLKGTTLSPPFGEQSRTRTSAPVENVRFNRWRNSNATV